VPDAILDRMKSVTLEEAWATLRSAGYEQQYEDGWTTLYPDKILVGRALTSTWIPGRLDLQRVIEADEETRLFTSASHQYPTDWSGLGRTILFTNSDEKTQADIWMASATGTRHCSSCGRGWRSTREALIWRKRWRWCPPKTANGMKPAPPSGGNGAADRCG
jgi:hypothetical protein